MRVLAITNQYPSPERPGDAPCIQDQIEALRAEGVEIDLRVIDGSRSPWSYLAAMAGVFRTNFGRRHYDVIHGYYGYCGLVAKAQWRAPVLTTYRGSDLLFGIDGRIGRRVAKHVDALVTMTEEMKVASGREDCEVIPFGVRIDLYPRNEREAVRRELGMGETERIVLYPYHPSRTVKRYDLIQGAVERAARDVPGLRILAVDDATPAEIARHFVAADVLIMASDYEGSPLAIREAMAANLPVVSVDVGDVGDLISGLHNCRIVDRTVDALAAGVTEVLADGLRSNGLERIADRDSVWSAQRILDIYRRLAPKAG